MPLGDGQGRLGLQYAAPSFVTVGSTSTVVLSADNAKKCEYIAIVNDSNQEIYIGIGSAAVVGSGIRLNSGGGSLVFESNNVPKVAINAICVSGSKNLTLQVGS